MTTATHDPARTPATVSDPTTRPRRMLLRIDGAFLVAVGAVQVTFELISHYTGGGILGETFEGSPYTIGWVENHGLALLIGLVFITIGARDLRPSWHAFGIALHAFLGTANVVFWDAFVTFDTVVAGVLATAAHVLFVGAHGVALVAARRSAAPVAG